MGLAYSGPEHAFRPPVVAVLPERLHIAECLRDIGDSEILPHFRVLEKISSISDSETGSLSFLNCSLPSDVEI